MRKQNHVFKTVLILMCISMACWVVFGLYLYIYGPPLESTDLKTTKSLEYAVKDSYGRMIDPSSVIANPYVINTDDYQIVDDEMAEDMPWLGRHKYDNEFNTSILPTDLKYYPEQYDFEGEIMDSNELNAEFDTSEYNIKFSNNFGALAGKYKHPPIFTESLISKIPLSTSDSSGKIYYPVGKEFTQYVNDVEDFSYTPLFNPNLVVIKDNESNRSYGIKEYERQAVGQKTSHPSFYYVVNNDLDIEKKLEFELINPLNRIITVEEAFDQGYWRTTYIKDPILLDYSNCNDSTEVLELMIKAYGSPSAVLVPEEAMSLIDHVTNNCYIPLNRDQGYDPEYFFDVITPSAVRINGEDTIFYNIVFERENYVTCVYVEEKLGSPCSYNIKTTYFGYGYYKTMKSTVWNKHFINKI